jgi:hypothetical protein
MTAVPVTAGELVDVAWLNAIGMRKLYSATIANGSTGTFDTGVNGVLGTGLNHQHLLIVAQFRATGSAALFDVALSFNGDGGANYDTIANDSLNGAFSAAKNSLGGVNFRVGEVGANNVTQTGNGFTCIIPGYSNPNSEKTMHSMFSAKYDTTAGHQKAGVRAGFWRNVAAINQIQCRVDTTGAGSYASFSGPAEFQVYGLGPAF